MHFTGYFRFQVGTQSSCAIFLHHSLLNQRAISILVSRKQKGAHGSFKNSSESNVSSNCKRFSTVWLHPLQPILSSLTGQQNENSIDLQLAK